MIEIPIEFQDLLKDENKAFAFLGTIMNDGSPQVTPVWFNFKDGHILVNSAKGRTKDRNMCARPKITLAIPDPKNPYRYLQIRGKVVKIVEEDGAAHIHELSWKYRGRPYEIPAGQQRVQYWIEPMKINSAG